MIGAGSFFVSRRKKSLSGWMMKLPLHPSFHEAGKSRLQLVLHPLPFVKSVPLIPPPGPLSPMHGRGYAMPPGG